MVRSYGGYRRSNAFGLTGLARQEASSNPAAAHAERTTGQGHGPISATSANHRTESSVPSTLTLRRRDPPPRNVTARPWPSRCDDGRCMVDRRLSVRGRRRRPETATLRPRRALPWAHLGSPRWGCSRLAWHARTAGCPFLPFLARTPRRAPGPLTPPRAGAIVAPDRREARSRCGLTPGNPVEPP